jgi:hypothetical protein
MTTGATGVVVLLLVAALMVVVAIMLGRHVLRRGRAGSLAQIMLLLGVHMRRGDGRDAIGGHRVLHLVVVAGPRREGRRGMGATTMSVVIHATMGRGRRRRYEAPPRPTARALVLTLLKLAHVLVLLIWL